MTGPAAAVKRSITTALTLLIAAAYGDPSGPPPQRAYRAPRQLGLVRAAPIRESSGLAVCRVDGRFLWTHNDSGDQPRLFLINLRGELRQTYTVRGVRAIDWEDICSFRYRNERYLLIGDVGDNGSRRPFVTLYLLREPVPLEKTTIDAPPLPPFQTIHLRYPAGPRDCEAVAVDATTGTAYLIEKRLLGKARVFAVPLFVAAKNRPRMAQPVATVNVPLVTAMDITPDGQRAVLLTYGDAIEFTRAKTESWQTAFTGPGRQIRTPPRRQGESICFGTDGHSLYLTSEGADQPLWELGILKR